MKIWVFFKRRMDSFLLGTLTCAAFDFELSWWMIPIVLLGSFMQTLQDDQYLEDYKNQ